MVDAGIALDALDIEQITDVIEDFQKINQKLQIKKRLDAYLEKQWLKDCGWDLEDELFNDAFFADETA